MCFQWVNLYRYVEVNTSPALFRHGRCLTKMMPKMMEELVAALPPLGDAKVAMEQEET